MITLFWYQHVGGGGFQFQKLVDVGYQTLLMLKDLGDIQRSQGLAIIVSKTTLAREVGKWINIIAQGFISVGILAAAYTIAKDPRKKYIEFLCIVLCVLRL
ncbi:hypothetical protein [Thermococcus peptonophilus]|uniref:hypothetical protein n=1 Tax=Thermococcus peptonophilus TaxID=53952 RepID=UPI0034671418